MAWEESSGSMAVMKLQPRCGLQSSEGLTGAVGLRILQDGNPPAIFQDGSLP